MKNIKTAWNFGLLYKSEKDPQIEKDMKTIESSLTSFAKKYEGKDFISSSKKLKLALDDYSNLEKVLNSYKPWWYFHLKKDIDSQDQFVQAKSAQYQQRITKAANQITFFRLKLGKIPVAQQKKFLNAQELEDYSYLLQVIFDKAKHDLTEEEEKLASLLSQPGYSMWVNGQDKLLSSQTVNYKNKALPVAQALAMLGDLPQADRRALHKEINKTLFTISHFAEAEINAVYNFKKITDEKRGYAKPYSATVLNHETDERTVENLVSLVTKNFKISQRFYKLHAKLLKQKKITMADRGVKIGEIKRKFDFSTSVSIVKKAFAKVDKKYVEIFDSFLENGQIDVYPKKGKTGGAYCSSGGDNPTFVLLNHADNIHSLETIAHEMGHSFHSEMSKSQLPHYREYTTAVAEVASTFFEQVAIEELETELDKKDYTILLHNKIMGDISTIFRQIACFNFELELHQRIRSEGQLSSQEIAKLLSKHLKSYLGDSVEVTDQDGYFYVNWSHIRRFFYVYSYAYGQIISRALFEKWKEDKSYAKKIEQFLRAGGSMSPKDIFKSIGIDTSNPKFFETGLKAIERDIDKLEKLSKKL